MNKSVLFLALILVLGSSACKKYGHQYPEDPGRSEKKSMERLTNKWWKLKQTFVNGKEYTDTVENAIGEFQIYFSPNKESTMYLGSYKSIHKPDGEATVWIMNEQKEVIDLILHHTNPTILTYAPLHYPYHSPNYGGAKILKLTETEFKITSYNPQADTVVTTIFGL